MDMHSFIPAWGNESSGYEGISFFFSIQQKSDESKAEYECKIDYWLLASFFFFSTCTAKEE